MIFAVTSPSGKQVFANGLVAKSAPGHVLTSALGVQSTDSPKLDCAFGHSLTHTALYISDDPEVVSWRFVKNLYGYAVKSNATGRVAVNV